MRIEDPGSGAYTGIAIGYFPIRSSDQLRASGWFLSGTGSVGSVFIEFYDGFGSPIIPPGGSPHSVGSLGSNWVLLETPWSAPPPGAASAVLLLYSCMACGGDFYVDDVRLDIRVRVS